MMDRRTLAGVVKRLVAPIVQRVQLMVSRGVVEVVNDGLKCQGLQVSLLADELRDDVERFQEYGFTSVPFTDGEAEALFLSVGGNRSHGIVACVTDRSRRPRDLVEGDVGLFTDKGLRVYLNTTEDVVHIGAKAAAEFIAQAAKTDARIKAVEDYIKNTAVLAVDTHEHTYVAPLIPTAAAVTTPPHVPPATLPVLVNGTSVAATKAKVT